MCAGGGLLSRARTRPFRFLAYFAYLSVFSNICRQVLVMDDGVFFFAPIVDLNKVPQPLPQIRRPPLFFFFSLSLLTAMLHFIGPPREKVVFTP